MTTIVMGVVNDRNIRVPLLVRGYALMLNNLPFKLASVYGYFMCFNCFFFAPTVRGSSREEDDQSNKSTKQRAQSNLYDNSEHSSTLSEAQDVSDVDFLDDEAEEGFLSSEVEEGESEANEGSDSCEGGEGYTLDEAEEEKVYLARKKRRRAEIESDSEMEGEVKTSKRRTYVADSSSNEEDVNNEVVLKETKEEPSPNSEDGESGSLSELDSKLEVKVVLLLV